MQRSRHEKSVAASQILGTVEGYDVEKHDAYNNGHETRSAPMNVARFRAK